MLLKEAIGTPFQRFQSTFHLQTLKKWKHGPFLRSLLLRYILLLLIT